MMETTTALDRIKALAVREHLSLGVMATKSPRDFALVLASAGCVFSANHVYSERDVNERLKAWLGGAGAMIGADHVELRRWLVDNGVLARDGYGREYTAGAPRADLADAMRALAGHDLATLVRDARASEAARRAARKAQWDEAH